MQNANQNIGLDGDEDDSIKNLYDQSGSTASVPMSFDSRNFTADRRISTQEKMISVNVWRSPSSILSLDHHWKKPLFITTGETVDVWDYNRSEPINSFEWGTNRVR